MKLLCKSHARACGFTLTETIVTMAIFMLVSSGIIMSHLFGLKMCEITKAKLGANDDSRRALSRLIGEIRSATWVRIGSGSATSFTEAAPNEMQSGNAVQLYLTSDTNQWIRYFLDPTTPRLNREENGSASVSLVAHSLTNATVFTSEDSSGNVLANNANNRVIGLVMQFFQISGDPDRPGECLRFLSIAHANHPKAPPIT